MSCLSNMQRYYKGIKGIYLDQNLDQDRHIIFSETTCITSGLIKKRYSFHIQTPCSPVCINACCVCMCADACVLSFVKTYYTFFILYQLLLDNNLYFGARHFTVYSYINSFPKYDLCHNILRK